jgi:hypothetical protein
MNRDRERQLQLEAIRVAKCHDPQRFADLEATPAAVQSADLYGAGMRDHERKKTPATLEAWSSKTEASFTAGKLAALRQAAARDPDRFGALAEAAAQEGGDVDAGYRELLRAVGVGV